MTNNTGRKNKRPFHPCPPAACGRGYGCSKGAMDQYVRDYARIYDLPTAVTTESRGQ